MHTFDKKQYNIDDTGKSRVYIQYILFLRSSVLEEIKQWYSEISNVEFVTWSTYCENV